MPRKKRVVRYNYTGVCTDRGLDSRPIDQSKNARPDGYNRVSWVELT